MSNRTLNLDDRLYRYLLEHTAEESITQRELRQHTAGLEWSQMQIAPEQGQLMAFLVKLLGVRNAIEIGVYTGYSSLSVAQALPEDGRLLACDINKEWTDIARQYWIKAGVEHKIDLRLGDALETLNALVTSDHQYHFDLVFIDADKSNYRSYFELCLRLLRSGGLILIDNTLWGGSVADGRINDADTCAIRELNRHLKNDRRVDMCMLPVADGLTLVRKK